MRKINLFCFVEISFLSYCCCINSFFYANECSYIMSQDILPIIETFWSHALFDFLCVYICGDHYIKHERENFKSYFSFSFLLSNNKPSKNTVSSGNRTQRPNTDFPGQHSDHWAIETHSPHVLFDGRIMIMLLNDYVLLFDRSCERPVKLGQHSLLKR